MRRKSMKKFLAVLVVLTLIAGAAFAQFSGGGSLKAQLLGGDSKNTGVDNVTTGFESSWNISGSITNEENTAGAKGNATFNMHNKGVPIDFDPWDSTYFYAWWQPIPQIFLKLGKIGEDSKYWAGSGIVGWGFQSNDLLLSPAFADYNGFAGAILGDSHAYFNRDGVMNIFGALQLSIIPFGGLTLNLGWGLTKVDYTAHPGFSDDDIVWDPSGAYYDKVGVDWSPSDGVKSIKDAYSEIAVQVVYDIENVGQAAVGFVNNGKGASKDIYAQWSMPLSAMKIELGLKYAIQKVGDKFAKTPFDFSIGFGYGNPFGDSFWLTTRFAASIATATGGESKIALDLCPSIDLGIFRLYAPVGFGIGGLGVKGGDTYIAWSLNPYIVKQMGGVSFWAGLQLYNGTEKKVTDKTSQSQVNWAIPIGFTVGF